MIGDWVLAKLSGEFVTDPSLGSSSGMFDLARRDWSDRVLDICGLDRKIFPPVVEPGTVIGGVTAQAAAETGLAEGTPGGRGGRRHPAWAAGHRGHPARAVHDRRAAASGNTRCCSTSRLVDP